MPDSDGLEVKNPEDGFDYRWVKNSPLNILKHESEGFEICLGKDKQTIGDLVLARIPKKLSEKRKQYNMAKPAIQARHATGSYFDTIAHDKAESVYYNTFIKPTTFLYKLKMFWRTILNQFRDERDMFGKKPNQFREDDYVS